MLTNDVAQQIVNEIIEKLDRNINIMNNQGFIIASGDSQRIGTVHEGALKALETGEIFKIYKDTHKGAKPGINMPILFSGEHVGVVGITGDPEELAEFGALVVTMTEMMLQRVALLNESEWKERLKGFLLDECLKQEPDVQKVIHKTKLLDIVWEEPFQVMVFQVKEPKENIVSNLSLYRKVPEVLTDKDTLCDFVDDEHFVILKANASNEPEFLEVLMNYFQTVYNEVKLGIEDKYSVLSETKERYERVLKALRLSKQRVIHTTDMSSILLLDTTNMDERKKYFQMIVKLSPELRKTLEVFFENDLNISQSAQSLFIHRNTMIYRLERIAEFTGKDPQKFKDAWELQCGIWLFCTISQH